MPFHRITVILLSGGFSERTELPFGGKSIFFTGVFVTFLVKKRVPLQTWNGPEVSRKLRLPDFLTTAQDGGKVVSLTHRPHLPPGNSPGTHFCYRLSRLQGHSAIRRIYVNAKIPMTPSGIEPTTF
jgi:hypothetical protein